MDRVAADNEWFNRTLSAADTDGDGVPDGNVTAVYDELYRVAPEEAADVVHQENDAYQAVRMVVTVDSGVDDDVVCDQMEWIAHDADGQGVSVIATGDVIVVTILPVVFTLTWVLGTMALLDIPFNIVTGMITGLTIGLGVDYSLHVSERFNQERDEVETVAAALHETLTGTGGALLSSAATTAAGFAVLLVVWTRFIERDVEPERSDTVTAAGSSDNAAEANADTTRTIHRSYLSPGQVIPVTVSLQNVHDRMVLRETVAGEISDIDIAPGPVAVDRDGGNVTVYWDIGESTADATLKYTVELPAEAAAGDVVKFEGVVEDGDSRYSVGGDETATVVEAIFQRVLEGSAVTDADIEIAVERDDITPREVERLRRAWLDED